MCVCVTVCVDMCPWVSKNIAYHKTATLNTKGRETKYVHARGSTISRTYFFNIEL